jgi:branched-chain amino acid transport system ATP-binding protein
MSTRAIMAALAGLVVALALIARADGYQVYIISLLGLTTIAGVGLNVLLGLTGQISLGHAAFYAIGAYGVAILTKSSAGISGWHCHSPQPSRPQPAWSWRFRPCGCGDLISQ